MLNYRHIILLFLYLIAGLTTCYFDSTTIHGLRFHLRHLRRETAVMLLFQMYKHLICLQRCPSRRSYPTDVDGDFMRCCLANGLRASYNSKSRSRRCHYRDILVEVNKTKTYRIIIFYVTGAVIIGKILFIATALSRGADCPAAFIQ